MLKRLLSLLLCTFTGASATEAIPATTAPATAPTTVVTTVTVPAATTPVLPESSYHVWLPYWEAESALEETTTLEDEIDTAIAFGAIFDSEDKPLMLPEADQLLRSLQSSRQGPVMLSIVNDVQLASGEYDNKSPELLRRLLKDDEAISRHIEQLFALVDTYGLSGLEIDYEAIKNDVGLWERFAVFIERLYQQFSAQGLKLRVVLSWDAPKYITLPEGPEYSVMCYNLYGYHSGPGPKADIAFLEEICRLYQPYVTNTHMAFATGGFDWGQEGIQALTQLKAQQRMTEKNVQPVRDPGSGTLTGTYTDESGSHTVWYADAQTLALWKQTVRKHGFVQIDLFRMGGNDLTDWHRNLFPEGKDLQAEE